MTKRTIRETECLSLEDFEGTRVGGWFLLIALLSGVYPNSVGD